MRDAHQSLLATRVRTRDLRRDRSVCRPADTRSCCRSRPGAGPPMTSRCGSSPRTRGSGLPRFARRCRTSTSRCCCAVATRSATRRIPTEVTDAFVREAAATGVDIFRIFDALNDVSQMKPAIDSVLATGTTVAEVALCYTGRPARPGRDAIHARLLPAARGADRRRRCTHHRDQGHGGPAARRSRGEARRGAS